MKVGERKGKREANGQGRTKLFPEDIFRRRHLKRYELKISFSKLGGIDAVVECAETRSGPSNGRAAGAAIGGGDFCEGIASLN